MVDRSALGAAWLAASRGDPSGLEEALRVGGARAAAQLVDRGPYLRSTLFHHVLDSRVSDGEKARCVELLAAAGADVSGADSWGYRPIHLAASFGLRGCLRALVAAGADVDARVEASGGDGAGFTPMHMAASEGEALLCVDLAEMGADLGLRDASGRTPLEVAAMMEGGAYLAREALEVLERRLQAQMERAVLAEAAGGPKGSSGRSPTL